VTVRFLSKGRTKSQTRKVTGKKTQMNVIPTSQIIIDFRISNNLNVFVPKTDFLNF
jgi:hypothetical protein